MSWIEDLRDAFLASVDALPELSSVICVAEWVPEVERDKLTDWELRIAPVSRKVSTAARGCKKRAASIGCLLVSPQIDENAGESQDIVDALEGLLNQRIGGFSVIEIEQPQVLDPQEWREQHKLSTTIIFSLEAIF